MLIKEGSLFAYLAEPRPIGQPLTLGTFCTDIVSRRFSISVTFTFNVYVVTFTFLGISWSMRHS